jgi:hypothetical protein
VRTRLLALPRQLAANCANVPAEIVEAEADAMIREVLQSFAAAGEFTPPPAEASA